MRLQLLVGIAATCSATARAETIESVAQPMTFADVFKVAVRTAPAFEHAGFEIARADAQVLQARAAENFRLVMTGDFARTRGAPIPPSTAGNQTDVLTSTVGVARLLPTNGTLELFGSTSRTNSDFSGVQTEIVTSSLRLRLTQPLLKGFGPAAQQRNLKRTTLGRDAAELRVRATATGFAGTLAEAYWRLALAWKILEVRRISLDLAQKQRKLTDAAMKTGKLASSELIPVDAAITVAEQEILNAELDVVVRSLELRRLSGFEVSPAAFAIKTDPMPAVDDSEIDVVEYVRRAIDNSPDIAAARITAKASDALVKASKRDLLPRLDLRVEGGPLGTDNRLSDSLTRLSERAGYAFAANLTFELPIGRDGVRGSHLDDRAVRAAAHHEVVEIQTNLTAAIVRTIYEIRTHRARVKLGAKAIALAQANVDAVGKKFELGKATNNELVLIQGDLERARLNHAQAIAELLIARTKLDSQAGVILDRLGIKVDTTVDLDDLRHGANRAAPRR